jgi:hypothetical protein
MARCGPGIDLGRDPGADMRLRPQKACEDCAVGGSRENAGERGHDQRGQERCGSTKHYADYTIEADRVPRKDAKMALWSFCPSRWSTSRTYFDCAKPKDGDRYLPIGIAQYAPSPDPES